MASSLLDTGMRTWRGVSGQCYPVRVHALPELAETGSREGIALAVKRDKHGIAKSVTKPCQRITSDWLNAARSAGATEIHVHVPDGPDAPRAAMIEDLRGGA